MAKKKKSQIRNSSIKKSINFLDKTPEVKKDVLWRKNSNNVIDVMKIDDDKYYYQIDGLASKIWLLIDGKKSFAQIKEKILAKNDLPLITFNKDFNSFMSKLLKEELISIT